MASARVEPLFATAPAANAHALALRATGDLAAAARVLADAAPAFPRDAGLLVNLAFIRDELGDLEGALDAYAAATAAEPRAIEPLVSRGVLLFRAARNDEARIAFEHALALDPAEPRANFAMYELLHVTGDLAGAVAYQRRGLERQWLFSARAPEERRRVLVLCTPGDLQANVPVDFLFDARTTTVHKLYLLDAERLRRTAVPDYDVVFNAIAESPESGAAGALADAWLRAQDRPVLNRPENVLRTNRIALVDALAGTGARLAPIARVSRAELAGGAAVRDFPAIARPIGSQAGRGLERLADRADIAPYLARTAGDAFYVSRFIDYRNADGFYRKYRIICVDGVAYPCHLAISTDWMIHYYNAPMRDHRWMRDEEARFLRDFTSVFGPELQAALRAVARALELEYVGIDATIDASGRLLIFEADPAMVVHVSDPVDLYPYKHAYVPRIFRALETAIDARIGVGAA